MENDVIKRRIAVKYFRSFEDYETFPVVMRLLEAKPTHQPITDYDSRQLVLAYAMAQDLLKQSDDGERRLLDGVCERIEHTMMARMMEDEDVAVLRKVPSDLAYWFLHIDSKHAMRREDRCGQLVSPLLMQIVEYYRIAGPALIDHALKWTIDPDDDREEVVAELHDEAICLKHDVLALKYDPKDGNAWRMTAVLLFLCCIIRHTEEA